MTVMTGVSFLHTSVKGFMKLISANKKEKRKEGELLTLTSIVVLVTADACTLVQCGEDFWAVFSVLASPVTTHEGSGRGQVERIVCALSASAWRVAIYLVPYLLNMGNISLTQWPFLEFQSFAYFCNYYF